MTLREREDQIFGKYRLMGEEIISDGALVEEYETARLRLLVILKEPNDSTGNWAKSKGDMRSYGAAGGRAATWNNLARWSALLGNPLLRIEEIDVSDREMRTKHLRRTAVVNLKKTAGCGTADMRKIEKYAIEHRDLLREQLKLYKPALTIAGGTFDILTKLRRGTVVLQEGERFPYFEDKDLGVCVSFYHPQQRQFSGRQLFHFLGIQLRYHKL
ncbi:MAG: hypothetical protein WAL45_19770 [Terracidiphilus sp.]